MSLDQFRHRVTSTRRSNPSTSRFSGRTQNVSIELRREAGNLSVTTKTTLRSVPNGSVPNDELSLANDAARAESVSRTDFPMHVGHRDVRFPVQHDEVGCRSGTERL